MTQTTAAPPQAVRTAPASVRDRAVKRRRVLDILDASGKDALLLTTHTALTWYLDGSRVHISLAGDPIAALLVDRSGDHLVTFNNEAGRIAAEELPEGVALHSVPWYGNRPPGCGRRRQRPRRIPPGRSRRRHRTAGGAPAAAPGRERPLRRAKC